jgi:uncharacterized protein
VASAEVYWWDDGDGIGLPDSAYLSYLDPADGQFKPVPGTVCTKEAGTLLRDKINRIGFNAVTTDKIRLNFKGLAKAQGILEWSLYIPGKR